MKKITILLWAVLLLPCLVLPVLAHPGSLDAYGGHWNHSTGEYHYHEGTNTSSGSNSSGSLYSYEYSDYQDGYADGYKEAVAEYERKLSDASNNVKGKISWWWLIPTFILFIFLSSRKNNQIDDLTKKNQRLKNELNDKEQVVSAASRDISVLTDRYNISQHELQKKNDVISDLSNELSLDARLLEATENHVQMLKYNLGEKEQVLKETEEKLSLSNQLLEQYKKDFHKHYDLSVQLDRKLTRMEREKTELMNKAKHLGAYNYLFDSKST